MPINTERGRAGRIRLLPGYRTDVTGLTEDEARALFVLGSNVEVVSPPEVRADQAAVAAAVVAQYTVIA